jgi:hypothetical protein
MYLNVGIQITDTHVSTKLLGASNRGLLIQSDQIWLMFAPWFTLGSFWKNTEVPHTVHQKIKIRPIWSFGKCDQIPTCPEQTPALQQSMFGYHTHLSRTYVRTFASTST